MNDNQIVLDLAGDTVTPTDLAERMEEKLHWHISHILHLIYIRHRGLFPVPGAYTSISGSMRTILFIIPCCFVFS